MADKVKVKLHCGHEKKIELKNGKPPKLVWCIWHAAASTVKKVV